MKPILIIILWSILLGTLACHGSQPMHSSEPMGDHATSTHSFAEVDKWARVFEDPSRDAWQNPDEVIRRLELAPHDVVWDVGSATGYFTVRIARAIPQGRVIGADTEPNMMPYLNKRAQSERLANLTAVIAGEEHPRIDGSANTVFLCNTYHHINARVEYFRRLASNLKPGGRVALVDWKPGELDMGPPPDHKLSPQRVIAEMEEAGYLLLARWEGLDYQYMLTFGLKP